jgi:hypothetical protein
MWKSLGILLQSLCDNEIENLWIWSKWLYKLSKN